MPFVFPQLIFRLYEVHWVGEHALVENHSRLKQSPVLLLVELHEGWDGSAEICSKKLLFAESQSNVPTHLIQSWVEHGSWVEHRMGPELRSQSWVEQRM